MLPVSAQGQAAPGKAIGKDCDLSMAGNPGAGTEQTLGCWGLEAHFCHQICWVTPEKSHDLRPRPPQASPSPARIAGTE